MNLSNPDLTLTYVEYYGNDPNNVPEKPYQLFFGKMVNVKLVIMFPNIFTLILCFMQYFLFHIDCKMPAQIYFRFIFKEQDIHW